MGVVNPGARAFALVCVPWLRAEVCSGTYRVTAGLHGCRHTDALLAHADSPPTKGNYSRGHSLVGLRAFSLPGSSSGTVGDADVALRGPCRSTQVSPKQWPRIFTSPYWQGVVSGWPAQSATGRSARAEERLARSGQVTQQLRAHAGAFAGQAPQRFARGALRLARLARWPDRSCWVCAIALLTHHRPLTCSS